MRDVVREYRDAILENLAEDLEIIHRELLDGRVENMERYKYLMGAIEGLKSAERSVATALKEVRTDDED